MSAQRGMDVAVGSVAMPLTEVSDNVSQMFAEHHRRVLSAAYRITGSMADAEDVAQAVFLRLASAGRSAIPNNTGSYLYRAAVNGALDLLRRRKTAALEPLEEAAEVRATGRGSSPEGDVSSAELGAWLRVAIGELSPRAAEMFTLRHIEGLGNGEIARMMNTSQAVVAVTVHHARGKLKKRLREFGWETR